MLPPGPSMSRAAQTAAWIARPGPFLFKAHREFGDVFTIRFGTEPPWVVLAHPDAVREVFTGDATALHAGKANLVLLPFLGSSSVLLLDGPAHLRQRKLMLPPFHGEADGRLRGGRPPHRPRAHRGAGRATARSSSRRGSRRSRSTSSCASSSACASTTPRSTSCAAAAAAHDGGDDGRPVAARPPRARPAPHRRPRRLPPILRPVDKLLLDADRRPPGRPGRRRALAAARRAPRGRQPDERPRAARRARHAARRRPRDDGDGARLDRRAADPHRGRLGPAARGRGRVRGGRGQGGAAAAARAARSCCATSSAT